MNSGPQKVFSYVGKLFRDKGGRLCIALPTATLEKHNWDAGDNIAMRVGGIRATAGEVVVSLRRLEKVGPDAEGNSSGE